MNHLIVSFCSVEFTPKHAPNTDSDEEIMESATIAPHTPATATRHSQPSALGADSGATNTLSHYQIIRRNGAVVPFEPNKIAVAMMKAFLAVHGTQGAASASVRETVDELTQQVIRALMRSRP